MRSRARRRWLEQLDRFLAIEAASGIVLGIVTLLALAWANSPWAARYEAILQFPIGTLGGHAITPHWFVDDLLMTPFFFVVGLEIRRELAIGELSSRKRAALPAIAALGGMIAPACLYLSVASGSATRAGWGIPTATDIAFAVGALSLLGRRVPPALRVLLLALAVIDDLGAIVVIAVFYTHGVELVGLGIAAAAVGAVMLMQRAGVRSVLAYGVPAIAMWAGLFYAGIHPTISGVVLGLLTPVVTGDDVPSPSDMLQTMLHPWVAYGVMPLFALANAGVTIGDVHLIGPERDVVLGVTLGLVLGKPIGIVLASVIALRTKIAALPDGLTQRHLFVLGCVGGIGFTMAVFVSGLAFERGPLLDAARAAVLGASTLAGIVGLTLGLMVLPRVIPVADRD